MLSGLGGFAAIAWVFGLGHASHLPLALGSFGASCVLLFGFPESPFSQPRNIIGGHVLSSLVGLTALSLLGAHWWSVAAATATAIMLMMLTRTVHPPAGSNPAIVMLSLPGWEFLVTPTLAGALLITIAGLVFHNAVRKATYPSYWFGIDAKRTSK